MRIATLLVAVTLLAPTHVSAAPLSAFFEFLNSDLTFGTVPPDHTGYDLAAFATDPVGASASIDVFGTFEADAGPLFEQTTPTRCAPYCSEFASEYRYAGNASHDAFQMVMDVFVDGAHVHGTFDAPVLSLIIDAADTPEGHVLVWYVLGPGTFDAPLAAALGVRELTTGGTVFSDMELVPESGPTAGGNRGGVGGDHTTPVRDAWDGVTDVTLTAPEPPLAMLVLGAIPVLWRRSGSAALTRLASAPTRRRAGRW